MTARNNKMYSMILTVLFLSVSWGVSAQYKIDQSLSAMYIDGTSSLHDWTEIVEQISGTLNAELEGTTISKITGVKATIPVKSIKSAHSGMDDNTYKALKESDHPNITYTLKSFAVQGDVVHLTGNLTIAGVTQVVKFKAKYIVEGDVIKFDGDHTFKMTDFGIKPPTAVMGTIKTGDEIKIRFNLVFSK